MTEPSPPPMAPAPFHPAPEGWRPLSGLAVTAFVLSLVCILFSIGGLWISELVPLALGVFTLVTVKADKRRGRLLAIWAVIIAIAVGSCSYSMHAGVRSMLGGMGESILAALSSEVPDTEKDEALRPWMYEDTLEENPTRLAEIRERYAKVVAELGAYQGEVDLGTPYLGAGPLFVPPQGVVEVGTEKAERPPAWAPGDALWIKARFERGLVHVAIVLKARSEESVPAVAELGPDADAAPIVEDVRFFRPRGEAGP